MDRNRVREAWDAVAETYAANRRADGEDAALIDELPADPTVLDVGCGDVRKTHSVFRSPSELFEF